MKLFAYDRAVSGYIDVSTETMKDASEPMKIKWYNTSYVTVPVLR